MNSNFMKTDILRKSNTEDIKTVWESIRNIRIQKQIASMDKLIKTISRDKNMTEEAVKRMILKVEHDGLIERCNAQNLKGIGLSNPSFINGPFNNEYFNLPDFSKQFLKGPHDWNCFSCHLAGEVISCDECFRSYHINCYKELNPRPVSTKNFSRFPKNSDKFLCQSCELKCESDENLSRKQVRKLLDFATHFIRKKSIWKDMAIIGYRGEIAKNEYLVHRYLDLELIQRKIKDGRYAMLDDLVDDAEIFVHDVCILHGIFSDKADKARVLLREIKDEIHEVKLCSDCYINAKAKLAEWITKPCKPPHKLIWAKQVGTPGGQYYWPAKLLVERSDGFEVRFFGGNHDRAFVKKSDTKSFHFRPEEIEIKSGSGFDRAWNEVSKLREKVEQGYYTQSSGESDLPPTEDEYSDEIYLCERRAAGLTLTDNHLANGSNYSLFSSLSSRRSLALERTRKSVTSPPVNGQVSSKKLGRPFISKATKRTSSRGSGGPKAKRLLTNNSVEKSNSSYVRSEKSTPERLTKKGAKQSDLGSVSTDESDNVSENSSSSVNMKSLNYKFSPKPTNSRSPIAAARGLRQNRKPTTKMSQLSTGRYTSLSDRIKMDLSSTDSSEFDPKEERPSYTKKRPKKAKYKTIAPINKPVTVTKSKRSPIYKSLEVITKSDILVPSQPSVKPAESSSSNEETEKCCSPDHLSTSPLFSRSNPRLGRPPVNAALKRGIAAADSTSNNNGTAGSVTAPLVVTTSVTTTSPYPNRQRINSGYNPMFVNQAKRMVHKCVYTTMPVCNCQEKFDKKLEDEKQKLSKEHTQLMTDLENKLKTEFEDTKMVELKKVTEEIKTQMQELIDKEKTASQEALAAAETRHNEALTNTKRRQWCRNCLKEAIYHCCWNTSYCSIQCQQEHWQKEHKRVCRRKR